MKKYQIIYADPPWQYQDKRTEAGKNNPTGAGGAEKHYRTMDIKSICRLQVKEIADENCYLFLWATLPMLNSALRVIKEWRFEYKTAVFVWIKMKNDMSQPRMDGIGNYTLNNAELVLLGRKGKYWRNSTTVKQLVMTSKLAHSEKPAEVRRRIVKLCGDLPRIELFARKPQLLFKDESFEGWNIWGDEVESDVELLG